MDATPLTSEDEALVETVGETNETAVDHEFFDGAHIVAAGVRTGDGEVYEGVSLPTAVGRASVCAEPVAIGSAIADGYAHDEIRTCVAVSYPMPSHDAENARVIPPCGSCREMLVDYNEAMRVIVPGEGGNRVVAATDLLPVRTW
jgi:cytidine deaminase